MGDKTNDAVLSIEEIDEQYKGEWVLVSVTAFDQSLRPALGKVIQHSPNRGAISAALGPEHGRPAGPEPVFVFYAEPALRSGPRFEAAADKLEAQIRARLVAGRARRSR